MSKHEEEDPVELLRRYFKARLAENAATWRDLVNPAVLRKVRDALTRDVGIVLGGLGKEMVVGGLFKLIERLS